MLDRQKIPLHVALVLVSFRQLKVMFLITLDAVCLLL